jgi:asparagine N-glycosylation enzyme membrane subunit Stt3
MKETTTNSTTAQSSATSMFQSMILHSIVGIPLLTLLYYCCIEAYKIRLYALEEYGLIIHEFDPYFNYRATEVSVFFFIFGWIFLGIHTVFW